MKRIKRHPTVTDALDLFDQLARAGGYTLGDVTATDKLAADLSAAFTKGVSNPVLVYGRRVEGMFGYVAAGLGSCSLVKHEDCGDSYCDSDTLRLPDFRLHLRDQSRICVEVKNCHFADPEKRLPFKKSYVNGLREYATLSGAALRLAIYWSRWNLWTQLPFESLRDDGKHGTTCLLEAIRANEMVRLGDLMIGTEPPLTLRVVADIAKPRGRVSQDQFGFTIGDVEVRCGGRRILDPKERSLALYFFRFGTWREREPLPRITDGKLDWIDFVAEPEEQPEGENFAILGPVSSMLSKHYNELTVAGRVVARLSPLVDPSPPTAAITPGYKGDALPLWRFIIHPG